jgi:hypothetical protein
MNSSEYNTAFNTASEKAALQVYILSYITEGYFRASITEGYFRASITEGYFRASITEGYFRERVFSMKRIAAFLQ